MTSLLRTVWCTLLAPALVAAACAQAPTLAIEREIVLRGGASLCLAWSPDGKWIASGGECGDVLVVDAATGNVVHELFTSERRAEAVLFSPDSAALFVAGRELSLWDVASGKRTASVERAPKPVSGNDHDWLVYSIAAYRVAALSRDGTRIAAVRDNNTIDLRKAADLELEQTLAVPDSTGIDAIAFDRDGSSLAVRKSSDRTYVLALPSGELAAGAKAERPVPIGRDTEGAVAFHPDDGSCVRARAGKLELHRDGKIARTSPLPHHAYPGRMVFVGDGKHLAIGTQVFALADGARVPIPDDALRGDPIPYPPGPELAMWLGPGRLGDEVGTLSLWSVAALRNGERRPVREHQFVCKPILSEYDSEPVFTKNGRFFAIDDSVRDALRPETVVWRAPEMWLRKLQPRPDGKSAWGVTRCDGGYWQGFETLQLLSADGTNGPAREYWGRYVMSWSPDCKRLLLGQHDGVHVIEAESGKVLAFLPRARGTWLDDDTLLMLTDAAKLDLVTGPQWTAAASLPLACPWSSVTTTADGTRAAISVHDRVFVVRIGRG